MCVCLQMLYSDTEIKFIERNPIVRPQIHSQATATIFHPAMPSALMFFDMGWSDEEMWLNDFVPAYCSNFRENTRKQNLLEEF